MSTNKRAIIRNDDIKRYIQYLYDISGNPPTYIKDGKLELNDSYVNAIKNKFSNFKDNSIDKKLNDMRDAGEFEGFIRTTKPFGSHVSGKVREIILEYNNHNSFGSDFSDNNVKYYKNEIIKDVNSEGRWDDSNKRERYINQLDSEKEYLDEEEADNNIDGLVSTIRGAMETFNNIVNKNTLDGVIVYKDLRDKFTTLYPLFKEKFYSLPINDEEYYNNHKETINQINDYIQNIDNLTSVKKNVEYNPNDGKDYASDIELIDTDNILRGMPIEYYKEDNLDDIRKYAGKRLAIMTHVSDDTYQEVAEDIYRRIKGDKYNHHQPERNAKYFKKETENSRKINEERREMNNKLYHRSQTFPALGDFESEVYGLRPNAMKRVERMTGEDFRDAVNKAISPEFLDEVFGEMSSEFPLEQSEEELPKNNEVSDGLTVDKLAESLKETVDEIKENEDIEDDINEEQPFDNEMRESVKNFKYELPEEEYPEDGQEESSEEEEQEESFEASESSSIESVNEEEEYPEEENIPNEMTEDITDGLTTTILSTNKPLSETIAEAQPQPSVDDEIHDSVEQFKYEPSEEENPLVIPGLSSTPAPLAEASTGTEMMRQDRNDIGHINASLEALNNQLALMRYAQSATDTNNILGSIVSIFKELPNTGDDEIANKLSEAVGPDGKKLFESKEEAARFIAKMRALNGNRLSSIKGGGSSQKTGIQLNITNKVVSNMPPKPFIVDTHPIPYQY